MYQNVKFIKSIPFNQVNQFNQLCRSKRLFISVILDIAKCDLQPGDSRTFFSAYSLAAPALTHVFGSGFALSVSSSACHCVPLPAGNCLLLQRLFSSRHQETAHRIGPVQTVTTFPASTAQPMPPASQTFPQRTPPPRQEQQCKKTRLNKNPQLTKSNQSIVEQNKQGLYF